jgi:prevent-host-death family protein
MKEFINIHAAKSQFSKLVDRAAAGEEIVIARAGKPVARLVPLQNAQMPRRFGFLKGQIKIAEDFDAPLPKEILDLFYEGPIEPPIRKRRNKR